MTFLRWLERAAWIAGFGLLAIYAGARASSERARIEGIAAFEAVASNEVGARNSSSTQNASGTSQSVPVLATLDATLGKTHDATPDFSDWSATRITAWKESLDKANPPQAVLTIPAVDIRVPVFDGTTELNLNRGAARIEGTARIGAPGNLGLAAHRDGYFRALQNIKHGDILQLRTRAERIDYRVVGISIVEPEAIEVLAPSETPSITLVTCYPFYFAGSAPQRFIVRAERLTSP